MKEGWIKIDNNIQQLKDNFNNLITKVNINIASQWIVEQAKQNPVFSSATLSQDSVSLDL